MHTGDEPPLLLTASDDDQILADLLAGDAEDEASGRSRWPDALGAATRATRGFRGELRAFIADARTLALTPARIAALADAEAETVWTSTKACWATCAPRRVTRRASRSRPSSWCALFPSTTPCSLRCGGSTP